MLPNLIGGDVFIAHADLVLSVSPSQARISGLASLGYSIRDASDALLSTQRRGDSSRSGRKRPNRVKRGVTMHSVQFETFNGKRAA